MNFERTDSAIARREARGRWALLVGGALAMLAAAAIPTRGRAQTPASAGTAPSTATDAKPAETAGPPADKLRAAVADAQARLALTEPWQRDLFDREVLPQYSRFIRDVRREGEGFVIEADLAAIRRYLVFYAPRSLKREDLRLVAYARADRECVPCADALPEVRRLVAARAESRGFKVQWATPEELGEVGPLSAALEKRLSEFAAEGNAAAALAIDLRRAPSGAGTSARLHLLTRSEPEARFTGSREAESAVSASGAVAMLLADAFIDLGGRAVLAAADATGEDGAPEVLIRVTGLSDFPSVERARGSLNEALTGVGTVEKRRVRAGEVTFGVRTARSPRELQRSLAGSPAVQGALKVNGADERTIETEILR